MQFFLKFFFNFKKIIKDIEAKLKNIDEAELRKKEITYKNWRINVQETVQREINKVTDCNNALEAKNIRDVNYISYIKHINKYGSSFQDDFDPKDYNPLEKGAMSAKVYEKDLINVNQRKLFDENQIIKSKSSLPNLEMRSRSDISWNKWLSQKYNAVESKIRIRSRYFEFEFEGFFCIIL
jgi:hypothetical protein